jgi:hypothetical protein
MKCGPRLYTIENNTNKEDIRNGFPMQVNKKNLLTLQKKIILILNKKHSMIYEINKNLMTSYVCKACKLDL